MSNLNYSAARELMAQAQQKKEREQPLWLFIYENWSEMSASKEAGLTFKSIAEGIGVSTTSFNIAKKKALAKLAEKQIKAEAEKPVQQKGGQRPLPSGATKKHAQINL